MNFNKKNFKETNEKNNLSNYFINYCRFIMVSSQFDCDKITEMSIILSNDITRFCFKLKNDGKGLEFLLNDMATYVQWFILTKIWTKDDLTLKLIFSNIVR